MIDEARVVNTLASRAIMPDDSQHRAIAALVALLGERTRRNWLGHPLAVRGVYCYGLPGRGKSLVVDTVFELAGCAKRRIHFHEFLREMNQRLVNAPHHDDRLAEVSRRWLDGVELLCFDEFHVHDIADAFLIGRFLDVALECGTRIVLTSNYAPQGLLPNPEFHERFQPTIERIGQHFTIIHFDGSRDYRFGGEQASPPRFFASLDVATGEQLRTIFLRYESEHALTPQTLSAAGRPLAVRAAGSALLWADFDALCVENRSHLDYLELAERWRGLIVGQLDTRWLARPQTLQRFVWLVDIFYDHKRALFIASNLPLAAELNGLQGAHDLSRTLSRLAEMQSRAYLNPLDGAPLSSEVITFPPANTSFSRLTCSHENS